MLYEGLTLANENNRNLEVFGPEVGEKPLNNLNI